MLDAAESLGLALQELLGALVAVDRIVVGDVPLDFLADAYAELEDANRDLAALRAHFADHIGDRMPEKRVTIDGLGTLEKRKNTSRRAWQTDDLRRAIHDVVLVDSETGEIVEHTPLERERFVFPGGTPRTTAIHALGLDPDEYCNSESRGWSIQIHD